MGKPSRRKIRLAFEKDWQRNAASMVTVKQRANALRYEMPTDH